MSHFAPIPGDPSLVRQSARQFADQEQRLRDAAQTLRAMADGDMLGEAIEALRVTSADVAGVLERASHRYTAASRALSTYADELADAQHLADQANEEAESTDVQAAQNQVDDLETDYRQFFLTLNPDEQERDRISDDLQSARHAAEVEERRLATATARFEQAVQRVDDAAERAIRSIEMGREVSGLDDTWQDDLQQFVASFKVEFASWMATIASILDEVSLQLAAFSLLTLWCPPLAAALAHASTGAGALAVAANTAGLLAEGRPLTEIYLVAAFAAIGLLTGRGLAKGVSKGLKAMPEDVSRSVQRLTSPYLDREGRELVVDVATGVVADELAGAVESRLTSNRDALRAIDAFVAPAVVVASPSLGMAHGASTAIDAVLEAGASHDIRLPKGDGYVSVATK